ncbi:tRNA modification GTPase TrmE [Pluteus cervinus]|uniref:tRNA modification GTPase TrmE n=1 Tax=Pluteus cervinus TaxID=181527 RepID=A0ACD3B9R7_9AGAR|nr:tRNA modification GTPase TrmE [Pluteus cervinus]
MRRINGVRVVVVWRKASRGQTLSDAQRRTIYALSTPPGKGGVAVIRVSGPHALLVWESMVRKPGHAPLPSPWRMERCKIIHPETREHLDEGLAVFFKGPKSFTTEDVLELHIHSGRAVISSVLNALGALPFCRQAEAGEFTRRAFLGGRLDLTQVEGLQDLINADTESQRRLALGAVGGHVRAQFDDLRSRIIRCLANVEALIDFGEGEEIEEGIYEQSQQEARNLLSLIRGYLQDTRKGEIIRSGIRLAIFGPPNAGKSSLLNFLAQRDAAIVTPVPGTTRDILDVSLDIAGLPIVVSDTAGLRQTDDIVEKIGVQRAKEAVSKSDVALCVLSLPGILKKNPNGHHLEIPESIRPILTDGTFILLNKSDLVSGTRELDTAKQAFPGAWVASLATGEGLSEFVDGMGQTLLDRFGFEHSGGSPLITRIRHRTHLESACRFLEAFLATPPTDIVLAAEELRYAARAVGKVSGLIDVEHVLDSVFKDFCIGK